MDTERYNIVKMIGSGATATVWLAEDRHLGNRDVAIKRANLANRENQLRFQREFSVINSLHHRAILSVYDGKWVDNERPYLVMPFLDGGTLLQKKDIEEKEICSVMGLVASALSYAHGKGIVHRDVKPNNIMFNEFDEPFLMDWGLGKAKDSIQVTKAGNMIGTAQFLAPEVLEGSEPLPESDVWAWGVTAFFSLTGQLPFQGKSIVEIYDNQKKSKKLALPYWLSKWQRPLSSVFQADPQQRPSAQQIAQWCLA